MQELVVINDVVKCECDAFYQILESKFARFGITCLHAKTLTEPLTNWDGWDRMARVTTVVIFVGNGGKIVEHALVLYGEHSLWNYWRHTTYHVHAKRVWTPGSDPRVYTGRIFPNEMRLGVRDVVIIDDVVSSGSTIQRLRKENSPWIPEAKWHALCWVGQRSACLRGLTSFYAPVMAGTRERKASINSLSTLIRDSTILQSYITRNGVQGLEELVDECKKRTQE